MWRVMFGAAVSLTFAPVANAACVGPRYNIRLGSDISIHRDTNGSPCVHKIKSTADPIYGSLVKSNPQHGTIAVRDRVTIVYRPNPGFKGEDSYVFEWVGKQHGTTPSAMTVHVDVTVR